MQSVFVGVVLFIIVLSAGQTTQAQLLFNTAVGPELKAQLQSDLKFVNSVQSKKASALHAEIFGKVEGKAYTRWFNNRVNTVDFDDCGGAHVVACARKRFPNVIFVADAYVKFQQPQIARVSVLFHEARHNEDEQDGWPHDTCPMPFKNNGQDVRSIWTQALLEGRPACDTTVYGSYGIQSILLKNIAMNCENCSEKVRADADLYANDQTIRIVSVEAKAALKKDFSSR